MSKTESKYVCDPFSNPKFLNQVLRHPSQVCLAIEQARFMCWNKTASFGRILAITLSFLVSTAIYVSLTVMHWLALYRRWVQQSDVLLDLEKLLVTYYCRLSMAYPCVLYIFYLRLQMNIPGHILWMHGTIKDHPTDLVQELWQWYA